MIGIIAAVTTNGILGIENKLPFDYPNDMKHFRKTTANSTVIMGRNTFEGIGKPLPKRRNIIVSIIGKAFGTLDNIDGIEVFPSLSIAIEEAKKNDQNIWLIGGSKIYQDGMKYADKILLTITPDMELRDNPVKFPWVNPLLFKLDSIEKLVPEDNLCELKLAIYTKI